MTPDTLRDTPEFAALRAMAARIGADPLQIQGPGGNVSLKADGVMLVKASGTWLADALRDDIFAPVDAAAMKADVVSGSDRADRPQEYRLEAEGLRPSIETSFHAALDAPVVVHTHCVATIAQSVIPGTNPAFADLGLVEVPYVMPGAGLARAVLDAWQPGARGAVLRNHGVIVVGDTVAEAEAHLAAVAKALEPGPAPMADPDPGLPAALEGTGWRALGKGATTAVAFAPGRIGRIADRALYPDQVIFLGPAPVISGHGASLGAALAGVEGPPRALAVLPGLGAAVPEGASPAVVALAEMVGEVAFRIPEGVEITTLTEADAHALLGWDAEKHRQALEKARTARLAAEGGA